jgi:hypothetical protein
MSTKLKNIISTITIIIFCATNVNAQWTWWLNFEDPQINNERVFIDTAGGNSWTVGAPDKSVFTTAYSPSNVIVTDTLDSYPVNDTSSFIITHLASGGWDYGYPGIIIEGWYNVDSDTLTDYGYLEFSHDLGLTWYSLDSANNHGCCFSEPELIPTLTGRSDGWEMFRYCICQPDTVGYEDTIYYRFTFISDNVNTSKDGLMFDNFIFQDFIEGLEENSKNSNPELIRIVDVTGRETEEKPNTLLIYQYSDGSTRKVIKME